MPKTKSVNLTLIKQALVQRQNALRQSTAHTKTRGEVSGGGKKPWRQKGTGRARAGSSRSPIWVGGGITFGPQKDKNYQTNLPQKMARQAKLELFKLLQTENRVVMIELLHLNEPKTKLAVKLLEDLNLVGQNCLFVTTNLEPELILATSNLPGVDVQIFSQLSLLDLAGHQMVVMERPGYEQVYGPIKPAITKSSPVKSKTKKVVK